MKNLSKLMAIAVMAFMVSCGGGDSPKTVAEKFLKETQAKNFDAAKKLATEETGKMIDMMASLSKSVPDDKEKKEGKLTDFTEKIEGDAATVTYKEEGKDGEQSMKMKKVDGKWLVSMSKADMSNKGGKEPKPEEPMMDEHTPSDSVAAAIEPASVPEADKK